MTLKQKIDNNPGTAQAQAAQDNLHKKEKVVKEVYRNASDRIS